jgi:hypothetical protein
VKELLSQRRGVNGCAAHVNACAPRRDNRATAQPLSTRSRKFHQRKIRVKF